MGLGGLEVPATGARTVPMMTWQPQGAWDLGAQRTTGGHPLRRAATLARVVEASKYTPVSRMRRNIAWAFAGNGVYSCSQWILLIVLTKVTSTQEVGAYALAIALVTPLVVLSALQLPAVLATDARGDYAVADYLGLRIVTAGLFILAVFAISVSGRLTTTSAAILILISFGKVLDALSEVLMAALQRIERMDKVALGLMSNGSISILAVVILGWSTHNVVLAVAGSVVGSAFALLLVNCVNVWRMATARTLDIQGGSSTSLRPRFTSKTLRALARLALPLGATMFLYTASQQVPRYFLQGSGGASSLGIFAAISYVILGGLMFVLAVGQSAAPQLSRLYASGDLHGYRRLVTRLAGLGAGLGLILLMVAALGGNELLRLIYRSEYADGRVFVVLSLGATLLFAAAFLGYGMTAARRFDVQAPVFALAFLAALISSAVLVPRYHLIGAAWATVIAAAAQLAGSAAVVISTVRRCPAQPERLTPGVPEVGL